MRLPHGNFLHLAAGAAALPVVLRIAWAQAYPTLPVRLIVPVAPGGGYDLVARPMGQWLSERLGAARCSRVRPPTLESSSPQKPRSGATSSGPPTSRRQRADRLWSVYPQTPVLQTAATATNTRQLIIG